MQAQPITILTSTHLPTQFGTFEFGVFQMEGEEKKHIFLKYGDISQVTKPLLVRVHSQCITGETFLSLKCDCREQLQTSMKLIQEAGRGLIIYLQTEGRGIGLVNKIKAYALQEQGFDTVEANEKLGLPVDSRDYHPAAILLKQFGVHSVKLLTNNPDKVSALEQMGEVKVERVPLIIEPNEFNKEYLRTKQQKLGHLLDL